jgi:hypothetical protein
MLLAIAAALVVAGTVFLFRNKAAATGGCLIAAVVPAFLATQTARPAKKVDLKVLGSEFHIEFREESVKVEDIPGGVAAAKRSTSDIIKSVSPQLSPEDRDSLIKRALPEVNAVLKQFHIIALPQSLDNINAGDVLKIFDDGDIKLIVPAEAAFGHLNSRSVPSAFPSIATEYNPSDGSIKFSMTCNDATLTHVSLYSLSKSIKDNVVVFWLTQRSSLLELYFVAVI